MILLFNGITTKTTITASDTSSMKATGMSLREFWNLPPISGSPSTTGLQRKPLTAPTLTQTTLVPKAPPPPETTQQTYTQTSPKNYYYWKHTKEGRLGRFLKSSNAQKDPEDYRVRKVQLKIAHGGQLTDWDETVLAQPCIACHTLDLFRGQCHAEYERKMLALMTITPEQIIATGRINRKAGPYPRS